MKKQMKKVRNIMIGCLILMSACMIKSQDVHAEDVGKYELSDTSPNTKYDVTGDGKPDTLEIKKFKKNDYDYCGFKILINGKTVLKDDKTWYYGLDAVFIQTKGSAYFLISLGLDNGDGPKVIYEYLNGELVERVNLEKVAGKIFYHYNATVSSVKSNSITLNVTGQTDMLAGTDISLTYKVGTKGKLSLANKTVKVSYDNRRYSSKTSKIIKAKYLTAAKRIPVYSNATGSQKAFTIDKGTKVNYPAAKATGLPVSRTTVIITPRR